MNVQYFVPPETNEPTRMARRTYGHRFGTLWSGVPLSILCVWLASPVRAQQDCLAWRLTQLGLPAGVQFETLVAYDSFRGFLVAVDESGHTFEWNGYAWTARADAPGAPVWESVGNNSRRGAIAYDRRRQIAVVYDTNDTIQEWNGQTWELKTPNPSPGALRGPAFAYDPVREVTVFFGGYTGSAMSNAFWEWDGTNWTQRVSAHSPPACFQAQLAFDVSRGRLVLFGGNTAPAGAATLLGDVWEWDGTDWTESIVPAGFPMPEARVRHVLAYDSLRQVVVLVGGASSVILDDVWDWDGQSWQLRVPQPQPPPLHPGGTAAPASGELVSLAAAYDDARHELHLISSVYSFHWSIVHAAVPHISAGPNSLQVVEGAPAVLSVTAVPATNVKFQWRKNGVPIPGATLANYGRHSVTTDDQGLYDVLLSASGFDPYAACGVVLSSPAALTVVPSMPADLNSDGAVDMLDFADFATMFTGPGE